MGAFHLCGFEDVRFQFVSSGLQFSCPLRTVMIGLPNQVKDIVDIVYMLVAFLQLEQGHFQPVRRAMEVHEAGNFFFEQCCKPPAQGKTVERPGAKNPSSTFTNNRQ